MNTSKQPMLELALSIATEAHRGQFDKVYRTSNFCCEPS
mgnify:CR=1 FL=1